jgi:hypothetical protein
VPDVLAERARFSWSVADYNGQVKAAHMSGLIATVADVDLRGD